MSYDTYIEVDTGGPEPMSEWIGNYTSNVSGMWSKSLTAAMQHVPHARKYAGTDDRRMIARYGHEINYVNGTKGKRVVRTDRLCLRDLDGAQASDLIPLLAAAVAWGFDHLDDLRERNPENGWGNAEGAITYLLDIKQACEAHPRATFRVSS
jgi:hypothetical protein